MAVPGEGCVVGARTGAAAGKRAWAARGDFTGVHWACCASPLLPGDQAPGRDRSVSRAEWNKSKPGGRGTVSVPDGNDLPCTTLGCCQVAGEFFQKSLSFQETSQGIVPLELLMETHLGQYIFSGENMNHCRQEKGC